LLVDGAGAFGVPTRAYVRPECSQNRSGIDAPVRKESLILGEHNGVHGKRIVRLGTPGTTKFRVASFGRYDFKQFGFDQQTLDLFRRAHQLEGTHAFPIQGNLRGTGHDALAFERAVRKTNPHL
jgi:hypothetical protein